MISGHLREKRGYYHLILNYIDLDGNKKSISKATGLKTVGNKKRAELMLKDAKNKLEDSINQEIEKRRIEEEQAALLKIPYFTDFLIDWLSIIKSSVETSTYVAYESIIMRRVIPYFEPLKLKLTQVSPLDIQTYYRYSLEVEKVSTNTVIHRHANIRKALQYALKMDLIDKNPADRVERPKKDSFHPDIYNEDEIKQLLDVVKGDRIEFAVILGAFYGLRRSEIAGLKWKAIDFDNKTITIRHTVTELYSNGKTIITEKDRTKTKSSYRTLPLVEPFEQLLFRMKQEQQYYKKMCGKSYQLKDQDYIYVDELGNRVQPNYITRHFSLILKKFHLKKIRFHDLRHSCASLLYSNGVNLKEIQEWLGHSDIATTSNIYTHLDYASKVKSANSILPILGEEKIS